MIEIKSVGDIKTLEKKAVPKQIVELITDELKAIHAWSDEDKEYSFEEFNTDIFDYGYIVLLEGNESREDYIYLGLSEGLDGVIPEASHNYYFAGQKWTKLIVVYNDSYTMSFWLKNCDIFDSYADEQKIVMLWIFPVQRAFFSEVMVNENRYDS